MMSGKEKLYEKKLTPTLRPGPSPFTMTRTCNTPFPRAF